MGIYIIDNKEPKIAKNTFISNSAEIIGNVTIGEQCFVGPGTVLRGDLGQILIGDFTSVQDNCVIHSSPNGVCKIGDYVTLGHSCVLHGCTVKDHATIGMGAIVSNNAVIESWCIVAEGCVVVSRFVSEPETILGGIPCKVIGKVNEKHKELGLENKKRYVELVSKYLNKRNFKLMR